MNECTCPEGIINSREVCDTCRIELEEFCEV